MFEIKPHKYIKNLHRIIANHLVFFNDGDNDILYTGTNMLGNRIIGAIVFEDDENNYLRYYHTLVTEEVFINFLNKKISLREILRENESFFAVDKDYEQNEIDYNVVLFDSIDDKFLPLETSFCPDFISQATLDYTFSLIGGTADLHRADPEVMNLMNLTFCKVLKSTISFVDNFGIDAIVYSKPAMTGSFELNFKMDLIPRKQLDIFQFKDDDIKNFIVKFFNYIFEKLPNEPIDVFKSIGINSVDFKSLENDFIDINTKRGIVLNDEAKEQKIIDLITYSVDNFKNIEYNGFNKIEVSNKSDKGENSPIAIIDNQFYQSVQDKIFKPDSTSKIIEITYDTSPMMYSIQVYSLNKLTGNGMVYYIAKKGGVMKIPLHLKGRHNYHNTIFTKNMDDETFIDIHGIGKWENSILKEISVTLT